MGRAWLALWPVALVGIAHAEDGDAAGTATEAAPVEASAEAAVVEDAPVEVAPVEVAPVEADAEAEPAAEVAPEAPAAPEGSAEEAATAEATLAPVAEPVPQPDVGAEQDAVAPVAPPVVRPVAVVAPAPVAPAADPDAIVDLDVRQRVVPFYPDELQVLYGQQAIRCTAEVWVDAHGAPKRMSMVDCPDGFHLAALGAMAKWRWEAPTGVVPEGGVHTVARTGFVRRDKRYYPGVTYFRSPEKITASTTLPVLLRSGKMPHYPRQVNAGDDVCLVELDVDRHGNTHTPVIDDCAPPFRNELRKVVRSWKWWWNGEAGKGASETVQAEVVFRL